MCKGLCSLLVGVFVGAVAFELVRRTEAGKNAGRKIADGFCSAKKAFQDGYQAAARPAPGTV